MATELQMSNPTLRLAELLKLGPSGPQLGLVFALAAALTLAVGVVMWAMRPSYVPLYTSLGARDTSDVVSTLQARNTPFEIDDRTGMVLVPSDRLREIRMQLAADGLPQNEPMGLELLREDQSVSTSQFMEQARYQHALETELARTVARMRGIEAARVHLAVPKRTSFVRDRSRPSASVLLKLAPGRALDAGQIQGIANLVASSVPYLELSRVAVVDQYGRLLTRDVLDGDMGLSNRQFEYKRNFERTYSERIEALLTPIVGGERVRAQVHAELDFSENERREEAFAGSPEQVRSEQLQSQGGAGAGQALGVPGALTNQPPEGGSLEASAEGAEGVAGGGSFSKSATRNFELDKTITHTRSSPGRLQRLSVAVVVDDRMAVGESGEATRAPREEAEIASLTNLVKEAVGFNAERGDTVVVINRSFEPPAALEPPPAPAFWSEPWFSTLVKNALAAALIALVLLLVIRPVVRALSKRGGRGGQASAEELDPDTPLLEADRLSLSNAATGEALPAPPRVYGDILNLAREMAAEDPKRVATVLRKWVELDG